MSGVCMCVARDGWLYRHMETCTRTHTLECALWLGKAMEITLQSSILQIFYSVLSWTLNTIFPLDFMVLLE